MTGEPRQGVRPSSADSDRGTAHGWPARSARDGPATRPLHLVHVRSQGPVAAARSRRYPADSPQHSRGVGEGGHPDRPSAPTSTSHAVASILDLPVPGRTGMAHPPVRRRGDQGHRSRLAQDRAPRLVSPGARRPCRPPVSPRLAHLPARLAAATRLQALPLSSRRIRHRAPATAFPGWLRSSAPHQRPRCGPCRRPVSSARGPHV